MVVLNKSPGAEAQVGLSRLSDIATEYTSQLAENDALFPVHRLDKATTGCLVFGRSKDMARELSRQFQDRTIEKTYYALVRGGSESFKRTAGIIDGAVEVLPYSNATLTHSEHEFPHKTSLTEWELRILNIHGLTQADPPTNTSQAALAHGTQAPAQNTSFEVLAHSYSRRLEAFHIQAHKKYHGLAAFIANTK
ncbi:hypothetical protein V5O48_002781 [Marasmius crinis-equi]|uniref:Pseudouridine synthase RsuA/RluA-like domain-containing protein n=1 Tax=Marasmius crinis-equi TaxID=585013 RepID=A0ABR3FUQ9_9AGAR